MLLRRSGSWLLRRLTSVPLRFKITLPYLILSIALALVATYLVSQGFVQTLQKRFEGQLVDSANRVHDRVFAVQETQLANVRAASHTVGVPEAVAAGDPAALSPLLQGLAMNDRVPLLDVLDAGGAVLFSHHLDPRTMVVRTDPPLEFGRWPFVQAVLQGRVDPLGDKYTEWVETPWGLSLYTVGPIQFDGQIVGAVLVGVPADLLITELDQAALARVVLYRPDGRVAYSTLSEDHLSGPSLSPDFVARVQAGGGKSVPTRLQDAGERAFVEAVSPLFLRGKDSGWQVGVALARSLVSEAGGPSMQQLVGVFTVAVLAIVGLGVVVAQLVATPVFRLVDATSEVAAGQLNVRVPIHAEDEIGVLTGRFNAMVEQLRQRETMRELFGRMVSEEVREAVMQGQIELGGELKAVSVLFSDIRAFTALSEQFSPAEVVAFLNSYFSNVTGVVYEFGGIINRYGGDSTLAVFGAPVPLSRAESARRAILAALAMRRRLLEFNAQRLAGGLPAIQIGIGINTGEVVTGNIGSEERFEYTVIGDTVNISARVQELCKRFPEHSLIVTAAAYDALPDRDLYEVADLGPVGIRGRHDAVHVLALAGKKAPGPECAAWAAGRGLNYRTLLEGLYLRVKGYPEGAVAAITGHPMDPILDELTDCRTEAEQLARHLSGEYGLPAGEVEALLMPSPPPSELPFAPRSQAGRSRRHRPGPAMGSRATPAGVPRRSRSHRASSPVVQP